MPKLKPYTVLLLYPDYISDSFGHETYQAWVRVKNGKHAAVRAAQREAAKANAEHINAKNGQGPEDFFCLAVYAGHRVDLSDGYYGQA